MKLEGKDGREWKFRSIDKDPTAVLPSVLQGDLAASIVQDQISASHPSARSWWTRCSTRPGSRT
jgi:hypothetical protein